MEDTKTQNLADTLTKSGLCASPSDALRMARSILGTEQKVSNGIKRVLEPEPSQPKSYKEEIDELIRKTSPEHKDYHVAVSGYSRDRINARHSAVVDPVAEPQDTVLREPESEPVDEPVVYELEEPIEKLHIPTETVLSNMPAEPTMPAVSAEPKVYTDVLDDERCLQELMNEQAQEIYTNKPAVPAPENNAPADTLKEPSEKPVEEPSVLPQETAQKEEFIIPVEKKTEQLFTEVKEDKSKPKEIKNPIEKVDLMNYFKFG
jgi:hypothetical protein